MAELAPDITGNNRSQERGRWITHYCNSHIILLVGEGDFSFSACLARAFGSAKNIVATSLDSEDTLPIRHWSATGHIEELKARDCTVLHSVDVNDMHEHYILKMIKFDRIVFNFPHAGHDPLYYERNSELIRRHKELLTGFFSSASKMLSEGGEVHVAHRNDYPYVRWKLEKLAKKAGLALVEKVEFEKAEYPGYHNKRGGWLKSNKTFPLRKSFTFKFSFGKCFESNNESSKSSGVGALEKVLLDLHV